MMKQSDVEQLNAPSSNNWQATAMQQIRERLSPPSDFPCIFSQSAFSRGRILFSFIPNIASDGLLIAANDLREYVEISRRWDGSMANAEPLLMLFCPETVNANTVDDYHDIGWSILQSWHEADSKPWPDGVSTDPHSPFWSMCFEGMQLFVNMSNPKHLVRKSRNLGDALTFVINPRERFDIVAGDDEHGKRVRSQIRNRVEKYDRLPHCPQLGSYQAGELEWWQYGILEQNRDRTDRCPFVNRTMERFSKV